MTTSVDTGTRIDEIADGLFRISTPVPIPAIPGGFSFNQYLVRDDAPLLFHTGPRALFGQVRDAIARVMRPEDLRYIGFSHVESDECGSLNPFLAIAPRATPLCGQIAAMVSIQDLADKPPTALADGEVLSLGTHRVRWFDAPHLPHGWECGYLMEETTGALLCGDLFTQPGSQHQPLTESDILEPSEAMRGGMEYFARGPDTPVVIDKLAAAKPRLLACMHGAAWRGDGAALLRELGSRLQPNIC